MFTLLEYSFYYLFIGLTKKDKFKCLYLLVETAVAVRQREKDHDEEDIHLLGN